jgi:transcriptional regulator with XRE-family HTH domain
MAELMPISTIGARIRRARKAAGLNQAELALRVGVSQPSVANWESGVHDPRRLMLAKIGEALAVSPEWLAGGERSATERDKRPAAAYLRRPLRHAPVIGVQAAARFLDDAGFDPHDAAEDYIPVTTGAERVFALFVPDDAADLVFPRGSLVVIDYGDRRPIDGAFCLAAPVGAAVLRRWRAQPPRLEPCSSDLALAPIFVEGDPRIIGCARASILFH